MMPRAFSALAAALFLAACGADKTFAPQEQVEAARHVAGPPASVTLLTTINTANGSGAHSALLVNGSERVLFDPAGTWQHPKAPVRNDVHFGMTDDLVLFYLDYHTRDHFAVIERTRIVSPEVAELVLQKIQSNGAVPKAMCADSISLILRDVPGFGSIRSTWFPINLGEQFGALPGVTERYLTDEDVPNTHGVILVDRQGNRVN
ncbi:hypothetical protein LHP98_06410 [Rhodobacter sp. Har01]|uniref:hypothetical protein n=1 Tax=Rhodobacter sp. Har01 TaxID=2883999 RepID=UPI001D097B8E|nr:hypothetical protein [Rhodobacter sp. Har01]MCB6177762.1 hypothetical protein [Rhodobacter sp. Har01]